MLFDKKFAERFAEETVAHRHASLPAGFLFFHATQDGLVETERFVVKRLRKKLGPVVDQPPAKPCFPILQRRRLDRLVEVLHEIRFIYVNRSRGRNVQELKSALPVIVRGQFFEPGEIHLVKLKARVAPLNICQGGAGQAGLEIEDSFGFGCGGIRLVAEELQCALNVLQEFAADTLCAIVVNEVVIAVGKGQPARAQPRRSSGWRCRDRFQRLNVVGASPPSGSRATNSATRSFRERMAAMRLRSG